jgi:hypothetical protein
MNQFVFTAIVARDWEYLGDTRRRLWVRLKDCSLGDNAAFYIHIDESCCLLPPGKDLEEGEEIQVEGGFAVFCAVFKPVITAITRTGGDEDEEG